MASVKNAIQPECVDLDKDRGGVVDTLIIEENLDKSAASIRKPQRLGFYSLQLNHNNQSRTYSPDKSQLKYLAMNSFHNLHYDLLAGFRGDIMWSADDVTLDNFLRWILENRNKFVVGKQVPSVRTLNTDFVSYRGVLSRVMLTPYEMKQDWMLMAVKYCGTIYLHGMKTDAQKLELENRDEYMNKMSFSGHRFEEHVTKGMNDEEDEVRLEEGKSGQFCIIFRSRLKDHSLVYAAEMDCVENKSELNAPLLNQKFIEIKTTASFDRKVQYDSFCRYKAPKWWVQSYLSGVDAIFVGFRDRDNVVRKATRLKNNSLPGLCGSWNPQVCINFLDRFFNFLKTCVTNEMTCYRVYCLPGKSITCTIADDLADNFLPSWYINETIPQ